MKNTILILMTLTLTLVLPGQEVPSAEGKTGTVAGRVLNEQGHGVSGSFVLLMTVLDGGKSEKEFRAMARSTTVDAQGNFGFEGVEAGHYRLCAEPSHVGHWNNCWWGEAVELDVLAGRMVGPLPVRVGAAEKIRVRVRDPKGLRAEAKTNKELVAFWASVRAIGKLAMPMTIEKDDGKEMVLVAVGPVDRELKVRLGSGTGKFNDDEKQGANPEKLSDEYTVAVGDVKAREIKVTLQSVEKAKQ